MPKVTVQIDATQKKEMAISLELDVPKKVIDADEVHKWVDENRDKWETALLEDGMVDSEEITIDRVSIDE